MVWSGGLASIRVPYDATGEDGRNYIDIGEEVPEQLTDHFTAGLFFRSGNPPQYPNGFYYWAVGITTLGNLEIVGLSYVIPFPGDAPIFYRQTLLTFGAPIGADNPSFIAIGQGPYGTYNEGVAPVIFPDLVPKQAPAFNPNGKWGMYDATGITWELPYFRKDIFGTVTVGGMVVANTAGGWGAGNADYICKLPAGCRPDRRRIFICIGFNNTFWRADVLPTGEILWQGGDASVSYAVGNYVSLEGIQFEAGN